MFRVIVAGGRDFGDYQLLRKTLDNLLCNITEEIVVVCGQAKGADTLGEQYAKERGYAVNYSLLTGSCTVNELDSFAMNKWLRTRMLW